MLGSLVSLFLYYYSVSLVHTYTHSFIQAQLLTHTGSTMGKSLDTALESHGGLLPEIDHPDESGAQSEIDQGVQDLEVHVPGVQSLQDPIVTFPGDTHHVVGREVEGIDTAESDQGSEKVHADNVVGP